MSTKLQNEKFSGRDMRKDSQNYCEAISDQESELYIDNLIKITIDRVLNISNSCSILDIDENKVYLTNIRALSMLYKIKKDIISSKKNKVEVTINYDEILKNIINSKE